MEKIVKSLAALKKYCEAENFKGYDPYDGLNSRLFKALPFVGRSAVARLVWIQLFKRMPFNLRPLVGIAKDYNAKGIGLFLDGYLTLLEAVRKRPELEARLGSADELRATAGRLADLLVSLRAEGFSGAAWGYNSRL